MPNSPTPQMSTPSAPKQGSICEITPVVAVVSAVADATDTDPLELPPLSNAINPEALNDLVGNGRGSSLESISFEYAGYNIVVSGTGDVQVSQSVE